MASRNQRAVTGLPDEAWKRFGAALWAWREDVLGYRYRTTFARERDINIRLVQEMEHNRRPGEYTKWSLENAADAYEIPYESMLAFLRGEADHLVRAEPKPPAEPESPAAVPADDEWRPPTDNPAEEAAIRPYFFPVEKRLRELAAEGIADPDGAKMFGEGTIDAYTWDSDVGRALEDLDDRAWLIAELRRNADRRNAPEAGANGRT